MEWALKNLLNKYQKIMKREGSETTSVIWKSQIWSRKVFSGEALDNTSTEADRQRKRSEEAKWKI